MRDDDDLTAFGGLGQEAGERLEEVRMQARFRLVEDHELGRARREQGGGQQDISERAFGKLGDIQLSQEPMLLQLKEMRFMKRTLTAALTVAAVIIGAVAAYAANPMVGGAPMYASKNIIENAVNSKDHTTLVTAVKAAGLVDTLQGSGPFTVFAPTNAAFAKLPAGTVKNLLKPENKQQLTKVLTCHVAAAKALSENIKAMVDADGGKHSVATAGGCTISASYKGNKITLKDENGRTARVTIADVRQSNGVIHVIDTVLLPKM
jgi:uncharacterized surface protein with fasciclin (FAS1) repeats